MKRKVFGAALLAITNLGHTPLRATAATVDLPTLKARKATLDADIPVLKAKDLGDVANAEALQDAESELQSVTAQIEASELRARNNELESSVRAQRETDADLAVKAAVKRGAIAPQDLNLQAKWKERCIEDPENLVLLASSKGSAAVENRRIVMPRGVITREDSVVVLRAYNAEKDPLRKAEIFHKDLAKRITDKEELPLRAASINTPGTLTGEIVAQQALELLTLEEPTIAAFSTDFSNEAVKLNTQVVSRIVGIPASADYSVDNGYVSNASVFTDVPVTITAHRFTQAEFNAEELAGTNRRLFDEIAPAQADAIGHDAISIALAVITAANFTEAAIVEALVNMGLPTVTKIGGALRDRGVRRDRSLLLTGTYYDALFADGTIALLGAYQQAQLISSDEMTQLRGFNVLRCPTLPAAENLKGFGCGKSAVVVAGRVPGDYANALPGVTGGGTSQVITNPKSGMSVHLVQFVDHQKGKAYSRMAYMLGAAKGQEKAGQRLTT